MVEGIGGPWTIAFLLTQGQLNVVDDNLGLAFAAQRSGAYRSYITTLPESVDIPCLQVSRFPAE